MSKKARGGNERNGCLRCQVASAPTGTVQVYLPAEPLTTFSLRDTTAGNSGADLQRRMKAFSSIWDELTQAAALDDRQTTIRGRRDRPRS